MAETPENDPVTEARQLLARRTPGDWYAEPPRMALAGVIPELFGPDGCSCCGRLGEPLWRGRTDINGRRMLAHVHQNPDGYDTGHHRVYSWPDFPAPSEVEICGNYDYEDGGVARPEDTDLIAAAPRLLAALADEVERLRSELDAAQLRLIAAQNPGIDMDEVRRLRSGRDDDPC